MDEKTDWAEWDAFVASQIAVSKEMNERLEKYRRELKRARQVRSLADADRLIKLIDIEWRDICQFSRNLAQLIR